MSHFRTAVVCLLFVSAAFAGCSRGQSADTSAQASGGGAPSSTPASAGSPAALRGGMPPGAVDTVSGPVLETMNASNYTYVRVKTDKGEVWAASAQFPIAVGDRVSVPLETPMQNFHSPSLNRDFALIYFASRIVPEGHNAAASGAGGQASPAALPLAVAHSGGQSSAASAAPAAPQGQAPAGTTPVAKVWAERKALAGKTVTVHGKVVKFNGGILDRNWIHLQDGSGKAEDGTNDILVTTDATARVGDTITATGVVAVDKDFTAGYAYKVLIEKATIK